MFYDPGSDPIHLLFYWLAMLPPYLLQQSQIERRFLFLRRAL